MSGSSGKRGRPKKPSPRAQDVRGAKYLAQILDLLAPLHEQRPDPKRQLHYDQYCAWLLLYFFSPILTSLRGLQQASDLGTVRRKLGLSRFSLGSFSEAGSVFDPELLVPIMEQIGERLEDIESDVHPGPRGLRPTAVDGTLLHALPKMVWALWRDDGRHAAKLHLQFDLCRGAPEHPVVGDAQTSECRTLEQALEAGRLYIADRGYFDYDLMQKIMALGSSFVTRVRQTVVYDVELENEIDEQAARAGIERDARVRVGSKPCNAKVDRPLRLVQLRVSVPLSRRTGPKPVDRKTKLHRQYPTEHTLILLTDLMDIEATHIALLYRQRWQIELFFRWFKKVLQADRPLALSENGMTIVVYCALIASLLVVLWTGRKPTKRTFEMLCFYFTGWAEEEDLLAHLRRLETAEKKG